MTTLKHKALCLFWTIAPKRVKGALYVAYRKRVVSRGLYK